MNELFFFTSDFECVPHHNGGYMNEIIVLTKGFLTWELESVPHHNGVVHAAGG